ncbi:hypothetical protein [Pseudonocardia sp. GCM10023141]|uniref:hypothetical protein n=1 Tax=Pseudonocardia sp. GCM10023141 TaxID=3252653 RepID=UPI0036212B93
MWTGAALLTFNHTLMHGHMPGPFNHVAGLAEVWDPRSDMWTTLPTSGYAGVWTGNELLIWGEMLLVRGVAKGMFGTKMRSFITVADAAGVAAIVDQQFEIGRQILDAGLVPILEPEVDIHSESKAAAEELLRAAIAEHLDALPADRQVMLKLSIPTEDDFYRTFVDHPRVLRVVALSGGYSRADADERLTRNHGVIASFSRALTEGLTVQQTDQEFDATLDTAIGDIYAASNT